MKDRFWNARYFAHPWVIYYAIFLHLTWGLLLLFTAAPLHSTPVGAVYKAVPNRFTLAVVLIQVGGMALVGIRRQRDMVGLVFVLPQQGVLTISAVAGVVASMSGHYLDGTAAGNWHIFADQLPTMLAAIFHTLAIIDLHVSD